MTEEILLRRYDAAWQKEMPVTLVHYKRGGMDLHCQTGRHHEAAILDACAILAARGLAVDFTRMQVYGSGVYYRVVPQAGAV